MTPDRQNSRGAFSYVIDDAASHFHDLDCLNPSAQESNLNRSGVSGLSHERHLSCQGVADREVSVSWIMVR
jgi:hypothetical protein